jgi:hypothetical protein
LELLWCLRAGFGGGGGWDFLGGGYLGMGIGGRGVAEEEEEVGLLLGGGKEEKRLALPEREEDNATITIG